MRRIVRMVVTVEVDEETSEGLLAREPECFSSVTKQLAGIPKEDYEEAVRLVDFYAEKEVKV